MQARAGKILPAVLTTSGFHVVHSDQRNAEPPGHALGRRHTNEHRANQTGSMGHGDCINLCEGRASFGQGPVSDCSDAFGVGPSRDFWDHAAIGFVQLVL